MCKSFFRWRGRLGIDNKKRVWGSEGCSRRPYSCRLQPHELFFRVFKQARPSPRRVWSTGVKWKPQTLIRSMKNGPWLPTKCNKTHPYLTLWLNFDFWRLPGFLVLQREFHYFLNTVLSDNGLIVSCANSYVKLVATSQRMIKSAFKLFLHQSRRNHLN